MTLSSTLASEEARRPHSRPELIADGAVHVFGLCAGLAGAVALFALTADQSDAFKFFGILTYALGLIAMLSCSAAYNIGYHTPWRSFLRRCDHCAIFVMIAGTYTPFILHLFGGFGAFVLTLLVWGASLTGIYLKLTAPRLFERFSVALYLVLSWLSVLIFGPCFATMSAQTVLMLIGGGALYTTGVVFHLWERLPFQNAIWHVFVLGAALCHYWAIIDGVVMPSA